MNKMCEESQELVDRCKKKLVALENKLEAQRATLRNLRRMAKELVPEFETMQAPENLPPEFQKQLNDTLREIDAINHSMTKGQTSAAGQKARNLKSMV